MVGEGCKAVGAGELTLASKMRDAIQSSRDLMRIAARQALKARNPGSAFMKLCTAFGKASGLRRIVSEVPMPVVAIALGGLTIWELAKAFPEKTV